MSQFQPKTNAVIDAISTNARAKLFAKLTGSGDGGSTPPAPARELARPTPAPRLPLEGGAEAHFLAKLTSERLTATVDHLTDLAQVPEACQKYMQQHGLTTPLALAKASPLTSLTWDIAVTADIEMDQQAALTWADYGVAETGSLINLSGPATPLLFAMLPLYHICLLRRSRLLDYSEDLWKVLDTVETQLPRSLAFLTGTSGTADIEAKNVRGAHGPRSMHVLFLED